MCLTIVKYMHVYNINLLYEGQAIMCEILQNYVVVEGTICGCTEQMFDCGLTLITNDDKL